MFLIIRNNTGVNKIITIQNEVNNEEVIFIVHVVGSRRVFVGRKCFPFRYRSRAGYHAAGGLRLDRPGKFWQEEAF